MNIKKWWLSLKGSSPVWKYHIDYPSVKYGSPKADTGWVVQGWVLIDPKQYKSQDPNKEPFLSIKINENLIRYVYFNQARPDVIKTVSVASRIDDFSSQLRCGFRIILPFMSGRLPVTLHMGSESYQLTTIDLAQSDEKPSLVLQGSESWLFLGNDTNFSVEQHQGYLGLSTACLDKWTLYVDFWNKRLQHYEKRAVFLVAPTKESVLEQYYPYPAKQTRFLETVFGLMPENMYIHPVQELKVLGDDAFYKTDTHWTHQGAQLATSLVAQHFGLAPEAVTKVFAKDRYYRKKHIGDLGNKLSPPEKQSANFLLGFNFKKWVVYDNALPNFGRVILIEYRAALVDATCLIFGSSSSYSMFNFLCRLFKRVVFAHTAGQLDLNFLEDVRPDYVIAQTNARFMVRPPEVTCDVMDLVKEKSESLSMEEKLALTVVFDPAKQGLIKALGLHKYVVML